MCCAQRRIGENMQNLTSINLTNDDVMRGKYLTFRVGEGDYGIEISYVTEIIAMQEITPVPHTRSYVKGIINLRGTIVPVIDMSLRFAHPEIEYTDRTCIIVLSMDEMSIGLIVDEVQEVADIGDENTQPPPKISGDGIKNFFIKAIGSFDENVIQLLDINVVFESDEVVPAVT